VTSGIQGEAMNIVLALILTGLAVAFWRTTIRVLIVVVLVLVVLGVAQLMSLLHQGASQAPAPSTTTHVSRMS
jgi:hypothetical protein